jgi:hypothetical protein
MQLIEGGNLGIGTTSPSEILHINESGNTTKTRLRVQGGDKGFTLGKTQQDASYAHLKPLNTGDPAVLRIMPTSADNNAYLEVWSTDYESDTTNFARGMFYVDTNNHVYLRANKGGSEPAGNLYLGTNSVNNAVTILDGGNVGIGTTTPATILNTSGAGQGITHDDSTTGKGYIRFRNGGTQLALFGVAGAWEGSSLQDTMIAAETGHNIRFYTNGSATPSMFINTASNVGIGTTSPQFKLHINSSDAVVLTVSGSNSSYTGAVIANSGTGAASLYLDGSNGDLSGNDYAVIEQTNDKHLKIEAFASAGDIILRENGGETMRLQDGNVGIGTTSPDAKLNINGYLSIDSIQSNPSTVAGEYRLALGHDATTDASWIQSNGVSGTQRKLLLNPEGGNVGIGTTSPSYKLDVTGDIRSSANTYIGTGGGYFYNDSGTRIRTNNDFYTNNSNTYLYGNNTYLGDSSGDTIHFRTNTVSATNWGITTGGLVTATGGVRFSFSGDVLDDYDEGSWTPVFESSVATVTSVTYDSSARFGRYIKIGNVVHLWGRIRTDYLTWSGSSGAVRITGIPFTVTDILSGPVAYAGSIGYVTNWNGGSGDNPQKIGLNGSEQIYLYYNSSSTANSTNISVTDTYQYSNGNDILFQITYRTD